MTARSDEAESIGKAKLSLKIALVDDHELLLGGLAHALGENPQIEAVAVYQNPEKLMTDLQEGRRFDLVVTDMLMGDTNGLSLAHEIQAQFQMPVLLMTGVEAPPSQAELARFGVSGFVHKSAPVEALQEAIVAVSYGQTYMLYPEGWDPEKNAPQFGRQACDTSQGAGDVPLSQRQIEVLKLVAAGAANKEIANSLGITENTVKTHLKHIFSALGVTKRTACVLAAKSRGLLE